MGNAPHWTSYISAFALPLIAAIAAWIAYRQSAIAHRQSEVARKKFTLDLFDRRMQIYEAVRESLSAALRGRLTQEQEIAYWVGTRATRWLFGPEVRVYLEETLWGKIVDLGVHQAEMEGAGGEERTTLIHRRADIIKWLHTQFGEFDRLCAPYLELDR